MLFFHINIPDIISMFWDRHAHTHTHTYIYILAWYLRWIIWFDLACRRYFKRLFQFHANSKPVSTAEFHKQERIQEPLYFPSLERFCFSSFSSTFFGGRLLPKTRHCLIQEACRWLAFLGQHQSAWLSTVIVLIHPDAHLHLVMGLPYPWQVCSEISGTFYETWRSWTSPVSQIHIWGKEGAQNQMTKKGLFLSFSNHTEQGSSSRADGLAGEQGIPLEQHKQAVPAWPSEHRDMAPWIRGSFGLARRATAKFKEKPESDWQAHRLCCRVDSSRGCAALPRQLQCWRKAPRMVAAPRAESRAGSDSWGGRGQGRRGSGSVNCHSLHNQWISPGSPWWMTNLAEKEHHYFSVPIKKVIALERCYLLFTCVAIRYILQSDIRVQYLRDTLRNLYLWKSDVDSKSVQRQE